MTLEDQERAAYASGNTALPAAPDGIHSHYDPDLLVRFKRAAEDLGSDKGVFSLLPGGDGSGLVYITGDVVGVIMPTRSRALELDDCAWARE